MIKKIILFFFIIAYLVSALKINFVFAQQDKVEINFFYSAICPHCEKEKEFLKKLKLKYPEIEIKEYEILHCPESQKILKDFYEKYQVPKELKGYVPVVFISTEYFVGFNEKIAKDIEGCIRKCLLERQEKPIPQKIKIPIFGEIDISKMSLPALTITLGALDGLNPCAMWVLLFLITLLINIRSRKRMWLVGGTFILTSGIIYYLILIAWLNLFLAISYVNLTRILIGIFALGVGVLQIKNFITYHPGVCKVLGWRSNLETRLKEQAEKIVALPLTLTMILGLIILALGVNLIEFFCSAGLPAIYTQILALNPLGNISYYLYLLLYTSIFILDDLIIFFLAIITLNKIGFTDKYNYWATLIGGLLIFILGVLLIFKPRLLMFG